MQLKPDDEQVAVVEEFECLGGIISKDLTFDETIAVHISKASHSFSSPYTVLWCRRRNRTELKMVLFKSVVCFTLLYSSYTYVSLTTNLKCLQTFVMGCVHMHPDMILDVKKEDRKRITTLYYSGGPQKSGGDVAEEEAVMAGRCSPNEQLILSYMYSRCQSHYVSASWWQTLGKRMEQTLK